MKNRVAYFGVFVALALIFSYVESCIPFSFGIPGVKLGLANIILVISLYKCSAVETYLLSITRVILSGFLFGNMFSIVYSLAGGIFSVTMMIWLKKKEFGIMAVSVGGGVMHNVGQLLVAMLVVETVQLVYYGPVLLIFGVLTGLVIGIASKEMLKRLKGFYMKG